MKCLPVMKTLKSQEIEPPFPIYPSWGYIFRTSCPSSNFQSTPSVARCDKLVYILLQGKVSKLKCDRPRSRGIGGCCHSLSLQAGFCSFQGHHIGLAQEETGWLDRIPFGCLIQGRKNIHSRREVQCAKQSGERSRVAKARGSPGRRGKQPILPPPHRKGRLLPQ